MDRQLRILSAGAALGAVLCLLLCSAALAKRGGSECGCQAKCDKCDERWPHGAPKCHCGCNYCRAKSKHRCCYGGSSVRYNASCCHGIQQPTETVCAGDCGCGPAYARVYSGSAMLQDTGCGVYLPCKRVGVECDTQVTEKTSGDGCGCHTQYCTSQKCHAVERPRVVPWWFTGGQGNMYLGIGAPAPAMIQDQAGGTRLKGAAGSPEKKPVAKPKADEGKTDNKEKAEGTAAATTAPPAEKK